MALSIISLPDSVSHVGNEVTVVIETSLPLSTPNLKVKLGILAELTYDSGVYSAPNEIPELWADPDGDGRVRFFIQEHLGDLLDKLLDLPAVGGTTEVRCNHMVRRYKLYALEYSGDPQGVTDVLSTGSIVQERLAQRGGIPKQNFDVRSWFGSAGWAIGQLQNPFLDWRGRSLRTGRAQDQWVYFNWQDAFSIIPTVTPTRHVRYVLEDGTSNIFSDTLSVMDKGEVWMIPVGFTQLDLPAKEVLEGQKILKYTVYLTQVVLGMPVYVSEQKDFIVDHQYYEWQTEIQYLNGLGTFCQLLLRGRPEQVTEVDVMESEAYHEKGMATYLGQTHRHATSVRNGVNHASGGLTARELKLMRELLASKKVMVKDSRLGWVPVNILNRKQAQSAIETARVVELEYAPAWDNEVVDMFQD